MTNLALLFQNKTSSTRFFLDQTVSLKLQVFQSNLLQLSNYQRKRNKNIRETWFWIASIEEQLSLKKLGKKKPEVF